MLDINLLCGYGLRHEDGSTNHSLTKATAAAALANPATYDVIARSLPICDIPAGVKRRALWDAARKIFGKDLVQVPQAVGDCVGVSSEHAVENCQLSAILAGLRAKFTPIFAPYHWGMSRLAPDCGNNACGRQDGSMGSWQARALVKYGCLALDAVNAQGEKLPAYSGQVARQWGNRPGPNASWQATGRLHVVKSAAPVRTKEELFNAVLAGNPVTVASNQGFTFQPGPDGFHSPSGAWSHQMMIEMVDIGGDGIESHVGISNQWGDQFGRIVDFRTGENWPAGRLRVRLSVALGMLAANDSFAYTGVDTWYSPDVGGTNFKPF